MNRILVTGGTGCLGRVVVDQLLQLGKAVSVLSSTSDAVARAGVQMYKGSLENISELYGAVKGADVIIHCASSPKNFQAVDVIGTKNLLSAIGTNKATHLIYISIVGIDKSEYGYYQAKLEVEKMITYSGNPFTILRTSQFHTFVYKMIETCTIKDGIFLKVPSGMRFQPVDISEVACQLVSLCDNARYGLLDDFGGPEVLTFEKMASDYAVVLKPQLQIDPEDIPGLRYDLFRSGVNLCPEKNKGKITWLNFLAQNQNI